MRRIDKPWGYELIWADTKDYVGKILHIESGKRLSLQYHVKKDETIMVQSGTLRFEFGDNDLSMKFVNMQPGESFHIYPGLLHRMSGITDVDVVEVSTPHLDDVVRVKDDYGR
jgi:mannose-6-phosphate isomerase-like protein (cupin superfamily)